MPGALHPGAEKRQDEARNEKLESGQAVTGTSQPEIRGSRS
jgi:hypothetical protein